MKITNSSAGKARGMTLPETMIALGLGCLVLAGVVAFSFYGGRSLAAMGNYASLDDASRRAVDLMTRDIRQAAALSDFRTNALTFTNFDGQQFQYIWDPANRTLTRVKDGSTTVLLTECQSLEFHMYQRTRNSGTNRLNPTTDKALCKLIDMTWRCSRSIFGNRANSETVQTAQVVLRN
jgi:type II secretory pathway component PulJ